MNVTLSFGSLKQRNSSGAGKTRPKNRRYFFPLQTIKICFRINVLSMRGSETFFQSFGYGSHCSAYIVRNYCCSSRTHRSSEATDIDVVFSSFLKFRLRIFSEVFILSSSSKVGKFTQSISVCRCEHHHVSLHVSMLSDDVGTLGGFIAYTPDIWTHWLKHTNFMI